MSTRTIYSLGLVVVFVILLSSLYFQFYDGFEPCPLCTLQRLTFFLLGIVFLFGIFLYKHSLSKYIINVLVMITSILGIFFAGRQVWLQHFPSSGSSECGVSLQYMLQVLPVNEAIQKIFEGTAECAQRTWHFLYLTMAEWALIWFILFFLLGLYLLLKKNLSRG